MFDNNQFLNQQVDIYKLTLTRKKNLVGFLVGFDIYIDGVKVGKIKNGQTLTFNLTRGNHVVSVNKKNEVNIQINGDVTADVVVLGSNNFGLVNISGQQFNQSVMQNNSNNIKNTMNSSNIVLYSSISLPIISLILFYTVNRVISVWMYGIVIGLAIVNIFGLNQQNIEVKKSLMLKNVLAIILSIISIIITTSVLV